MDGSLTHGDMLALLRCLADGVAMGAAVGLLVRALWRWWR